MVLQKNDRMIANVLTVLKRHNSFIALKEWFYREKTRKIANFSTALKRHSRFIDIFLWKPKVDITLGDLFFLDRAHHCTPI